MSLYVTETFFHWVVVKELKEYFLCATILFIYVFLYETEIYFSLTNVQLRCNLLFYYLFISAIDK